LALHAADDLAAAQLARGLTEMGVAPTVPFDVATLQVTTAMRPVFERLMTGLVRHGLVRKKEGRFEPTADFDRAADSAEKVLRNFIEKHLDIFLKPCFARACAELGSILRGEKDAVLSCSPGQVRNCSIFIWRRSLSARGWQPLAGR
jgi:hypothetical protein